MIEEYYLNNKNQLVLKEFYDASTLKSVEETSNTVIQPTFTGIKHLLNFIF